MTINPATQQTAAPELGAVFTAILKDPEFKKGVLNAIQSAGKTAVDAWNRHDGTGALVAFVRRAVLARQ